MIGQILGAPSEPAFSASTVASAPSPVPRLVPTLGNDAERREFHALLAGQVRAAEDRSPLRIKVPKPLHLMQRRPGMHYHLRPEVFLQLRGATRFRFPGGAGELLQPGELAVLATGLPHGEEALAGDEGGFRNLVVGFYASSVSIHFAVDAGTGRPDIEKILFFTTPDLTRIVGLVDYLVQLRHSGSAFAEVAVRGLTLTLLGVLSDLTGAETPAMKQEPQRIFQVKWLVRDQLYNSELNVAFVAQRLGCSADYLSHLFHKETGETLIHYIHRQRVAGAVQALGSQVLSISEIAWACGFADPGYFTRVFRKHTGLTPQAYRAGRLEEAAREGEKPKTIYHDRVDYSPGVAL
ncbi:AraC family transcriptional regulator [Opitutaceae bacterium TAV4]|nr:AraC family transcriptional regulator [Opitutaceae bacterium TAV4]RRK02183.1 AraC family transcriptional regulator [Opitutaceae bacterium TAV3]